MRTLVECTPVIIQAWLQMAFFAYKMGWHQKNGFKSPLVMLLKSGFVVGLVG